MIEVKNTLNGELNASIIKEYPELENITITPTQEEQKLKSEKYGFGDVTVKAIDSDEIVIIPSKEEQVKEGLFNKVSVGAIKTEEITVTPSKEEQIEEGLFDKVTVKAIETQDLVVTPSNEEQNFTGLFDNVTVKGSSGGSSAGIFTQLEYLESDGNQYIDTGVKALNSVGVELTVLSNDNGDNAFMGAWGGDGILFGQTNWWGDGVKFAMATKGTWMHANVPHDTNVHTFVYDPMNNIGTIDGQPILDFVPNSNGLDVNMFLFKSGVDGIRTVGCRIYKCKIYNNGILIRDYIPVRIKTNTGNELGMYDFVNNIFYKNVGTGSFIAGPEI